MEMYFCGTNQSNHDYLQGTGGGTFGEGTGTPLQYSCLENPMDGGV